MLNTSSALDTMTKTCNEKQSWNNHRNIAAFSWPSCCSGVPACYLTRSVTRSLNFLNGFSSLLCLKSDMLSHILWSVCLIRWRLTLPFSINVPFYFKWGLFFFFLNLFRGGNYHVKPVCKSFCWDLLLRIRRACFSFTGISVELMALLMLLSWKRSRERLLEPERLDSPPTQTSVPFAGLTIDITNIMHCTLTGKQNKW